MPKRQVLTAAGVNRDAAVPAAVRVGNLVYGTRVTGIDAASGSPPDDPQAQIDQLFRNIDSALGQSGGSLADLALVTMFLNDMKYREQLNHTWLRLFPDAADRPARNTVERPVDDGAIASCEFTAILGSEGRTRRQVLRIPGVAEVHNPAPTAVRVGNYVYCVRVTGQEPGTGRFPEDPRTQIQRLFENIDSLLKQAGGSLSDLAYITVSLSAADGEGLQNVANREILNEVWLKHFPNRADRPARHTIPAKLPAGRLITASFHGVLGRLSPPQTRPEKGTTETAKRKVINLPGQEYTNNPLPLALTIGNLLYT
jgi:2-iminobutanoate/2-iminopropanoate deaminase